MSALGSLNWQAQHPPLYYALMVPFYRAAHGLGWIDHLLVLRLASFAIAFAGLALGVFATVRYAGPIGPLDRPDHGGVALPVPPVLPGIRRLGNDSLCLLLIAVAWAALLKLLSGQGRWASALVLGGSLGLGLLTKAFFLPLERGRRASCSRFAGAAPTTSRPRSARRRSPLCSPLPSAAGGTSARDLQTGSLIGSDEFIRFQSGGRDGPAGRRRSRSAPWPGGWA